MADARPQGATPPIPATKLKQIASDACNQAFSSADFYEHSKTAEWNTTIINAVLRSLISEASPSPTTPPSFKFAVTSTIIQHLLPSSSLRKKLPVSEGAEPAADEDSSGKGFAGRRGMHSATGAYWNNDKDGMWSYKWESGESKGLDVVVTIIWISM